MSVTPRPLHAVHDREEEIVERRRLEFLVPVYFDARGEPDCHDRGHEQKGEPRGANRDFTAQQPPAEEENHDGSGQETRTHGTQRECGGKGADPPTGAPKADEGQRDDRRKRQAEEPVLLGMKTAEDVLPRERQSE